MSFYGITVSVAYVITDISGAGELKQHQYSGSGIINLFSLLERMEGNVGRHFIIIQIFFQISPTVN